MLVDKTNLKCASQNWYRRNTNVPGRCLPAPFARSAASYQWDTDPNKSNARCGGRQLEDGGRNRIQTLPPEPPNGSHLSKESQLIHSPLQGACPKSRVDHFAPSGKHGLAAGSSHHPTPACFLK